MTTIDDVLALTTRLGLSGEAWTLDVREYTLESGLTLEDVPAVHLLDCPGCHAGFDDLFIALRGDRTIIVAQCDEDSVEYEPLCGLCETLEDLETTLLDICGDHRTEPHGSRG